MTDSVRSLHATSELMHKSLAEIERQLDAVSIYCHEAGSTESWCRLGNECPFRYGYGELRSTAGGGIGSYLYFNKVSKVKRVF